MEDHIEIADTLYPKGIVMAAGDQQGYVALHIQNGDQQHNAQNERWTNVALAHSQMLAAVVAPWFTTLSDEEQKRVLRTLYERRETRFPRQPRLTIWVYDGSITVEYQAVTLSKYHVELEEDRKQIKQVSKPHLVVTPFRSPQLTLWTLGQDEWRLYWQAPSYQHRRRSHHVQDIVQLPLFDPPPVALAAGAEQESVLWNQDSPISRSFGRNMTSRNRFITPL